MVLVALFDSVATTPENKWRNSLKHLQIAVERVIHNFSEQTGIAKKVAAAHVERAAKEIREREENKK